MIAPLATLTLTPAAATPSAPADAGSPAAAFDAMLASLAPPPPPVAAALLAAPAEGAEAALVPPETADEGVDEAPASPDPATPLPDARFATPPLVPPPPSSPPPPKPPAEAGATVETVAPRREGVSPAPLAARPAVADGPVVSAPEDVPPTASAVLPDAAAPSAVATSAPLQADVRRPAAAPPEAPPAVARPLSVPAAAGTPPTLAATPWAPDAADPVSTAARLRASAAIPVAAAPPVAASATEATPTPAFATNADAPAADVPTRTPIAHLDRAAGATADRRAATALPADASLPGGAMPLPATGARDAAVPLARDAGAANVAAPATIDGTGPTPPRAPAPAVAGTDAPPAPQPVARPEAAASTTALAAPAPVAVAPAAELAAAAPVSAPVATPEPAVAVPDLAAPAVAARSEPLLAALRPVSRPAPAIPATSGGFDLDAVFPLAGDAPLTVSFRRRGEAPVDPAQAAAILAAPTPEAAPPVASDAAVAGAPATTDITHHLEVAHDGAWLDQLARDIALSADREQKMRFQLNPERLGALTVDIAGSGDAASVRFTADSEAARALIADAQTRLVAEARAHGLRIADTQVDLASRDGGGQGGAANPFAQAQQQQSQQQGGRRGAAPRLAASAATAAAPSITAERYA